MGIRALTSRGLRVVRFGNWWTQKIPPLLAVVEIELVRRHASLASALVALASMLACVCCVAAYGHVVNDWFDVADDERAGKPNAMRHVPVVRRAALCGACVAVALLVASLQRDRMAAIAVLALNLLWPTLYSIPVLRLKERGFAGVLADAAGSHVTPTIFAYVVTASAAPGSADLVIFTALVVWSAALGIKGILYHQVVDRANDVRSGIATFATGVDGRRLSRALTAYNLGFELPASIVLTIVLLPIVPLAAAALAAYVAIEALKYALGFEFALTADAADRRPSVPFVNETFYTLWLPLAAAVQLAAADAFLWPLPLLTCALFPHQVLAQARDLVAIGGHVRTRSRALRPKRTRP